MSGGGSSMRMLVLGGGAWGTALALAMHRAGLHTTLWARDAAQLAEMQRSRVNARYLPETPLPAEIALTGDLGAIAEADAVLLVTPAQTAPQMVASLAPLRPAGVPLLLAAKGILPGEGGLLSTAVAAAWPSAEVGVLTGPSFAAEVAVAKPTALTLALADLARAELLAAACSSAAFRVYASDDPIGAQVGGALKNVIAIACGAVEGAGLGDNARAAVITRGLAEISRLGLALGARPATLAGLSGLGDLVLTCSSRQSRNYALGLALGEGASLAALQSGRHRTTEGVASAATALALAQRHGVDLPICAAIAAVLSGAATVPAAMDMLLARPLRTEN